MQLLAAVISLSLLLFNVAFVSLNRCNYSTFNIVDFSSAFLDAYNLFPLMGFCIVINFLAFWSISLRSFLVHFPNGPMFVFIGNPFEMRLLNLRIRSTNNCIYKTKKSSLDRPSGPVVQRIEALNLYGSRWALSEDSGFNSYPSQRFTWSKAWCNRQQLWKAVITGDTVTRLSIRIWGRG